MDVTHTHQMNGSLADIGGVLDLQSKRVILKGVAEVKDRAGKRRELLL